MRVFIIAEAGVNHNGSLSTAKLLVDKAKESGADCIKFQTFVAENIVTKSAGKAKYQKQYTDSKESQLDMLRKLELSFDDFIELNTYCKQKQIEFMSTAFDFDSIDFLNSLDMKRWKIPSGDITNLPYLIKIAKLNKPIILSTGMSTMEEVKLAINSIRNNGNNDITILHCTTEYPTPYQDVNLKAMLTMRDEINIPIGYSDHTRGTEIPIATVAMGATVIEKHFTLDRTMEGPDHKASLEPDELKTMVSSIRNIEVAMGDGIKRPSKSEKQNMGVARKSIIAKTNIKRGEIFTEENLTVKRPGNGISPMKWFEVLGQLSPRNFEEDELIEL